MQTGVRHAIETVEVVFCGSVAPAELTTDLLCLETEVMAEDLLCVLLVSVLVVVCLTSGSKGLVIVEPLPETAGLISAGTAVLTDDLTNATLTVVTAIVIPVVLV